MLSRFSLTKPFSSSSAGASAAGASASAAAASSAAFCRASSAMVVSSTKAMRRASTLPSPSILANWAAWTTLGFTPRPMLSRYFSASGTQPVARTTEPMSKVCSPSAVATVALNSPGWPSSLAMWALSSTVMLLSPVTAAILSARLVGWRSSQGACRGEPTGMLLTAPPSLSAFSTRMTS